MTRHEEPILLQAAIDPKLFERFAKERDRFGMSNREFLTRVLDEALGRWEKAPPPAPAR